jgi:hypothetical protein
MGWAKYMEDNLEIIQERTDARERRLKHQSVLKSTTVAVTSYTKTSSAANIIRDANNNLVIYFISIPSEKIKGQLSANGWKWNFMNQSWEIRYSTVNKWLAEKITGQHARPVA